MFTDLEVAHLSDFRMEKTAEACEKLGDCLRTITPKSEPMISSKLCRVRYT